MNLIGVLAAFGSALGWAVCIVCFTIAALKLRGSGGVHIMNFYRVIFATIGTFIAQRLLSNEVGFAHASSPQILVVFLGGLCSLVIADTFLYLACTQIGAGFGALLFGTYPIVTAILAWPWYGQRLTSIACLGIAVTFFGVSWVTIEREKLKSVGQSKIKFEKKNFKGICFALLAAFGQAVGFLILKPAMEGPSALDPLTVNFLRFLAAAIGFTIIIVQQGLVRECWQSLRSTSAMLWILAGAIIGNVLGSWFSLIPFSERYAIPAGVATALMSTIPVVILPVVYFGPKIVREPINWKVVAGAAIAVLGICIIVNTSSVFS